MAQLISEQYKQATGEAMDDFDVFNKDSMASLGKPAIATIMFQRFLNKDKNNNIIRKDINKMSSVRQQATTADINAIPKVDGRKRRTYRKQQRRRLESIDKATKNNTYTKSEKIALRATRKNNPFSHFGSLNEAYQSGGGNVKSVLTRKNKYMNASQLRNNVNNYMSNGIDDFATFKAEMTDIHGSKQGKQAFHTETKNAVNGYGDKVEELWHDNPKAFKNMNDVDIKNVRTKLDKLRNMKTSGMSSQELNNAKKMMDEIGDQIGLNSNNSALMESIGSKKQIHAWKNKAARIGRAAGIIATGAEVGKLLLATVYKGGTQMSKMFDSVTRGINGISGKEFGNGTFVSTDQYNTERGRAMEVIQNNRVNAQSYLGNEAKMMKRGDL